MVPAFIILTVTLPLLLLAISTAWCLFRNYLTARRVGLPIIIAPISPENAVWMLLARYLLPVLHYVPFGSGYFSRFCHIDWEFDDKGRVHFDFGDAVLLATPGKNYIYLCDADAVHEIIRRERGGEFARPMELLAMLDVFGPNISTVNGDDWQRHRRCTASSFNEQSSLLAWNESLRQGQQMLEYWKDSAHADGPSTMAMDVRTLTLDVLVHAAFGNSFSFYGTRSKTTTTSGPLSYRDALALILENAILIFAIGPETLKRLAWIPPLGRLARAIPAQDAVGEKAQGNLITSLVRASKNDKLITQEEVIGNIFVFNFAGHDTTAHSFAFTFMLLAAHPEVQEWMSEEIRHVVGDPDVLEVGYANFPKLVRTLAVLFETLRLYMPLVSIVKGSEGVAAPLTIRGKPILVPAHTRIILNVTAIHTHPKYWGDDSLEWKPSRWIQVTPGTGSIHDREQLKVPSHGAYMPWSDGKRACPGKKFAQVEHVAVMVAMFRDHFVSPKRHSGETGEAARKRALATLEDAGMVLLLQMLHPERTPLVWERRV